ncbi:hypothetical protein FBU30_009814 [Linnemannia zychae]|nr:hypothetical protein FBU30_009814 [Linnemannia zychae]
MSKDYRPMRIPPGRILDIIQRKVVFERKLPEAVKELLDHARRYLSIYLPSAGFEISQTDRYSAVTNKSEACVIANRSFEVGDELRYCAGTIANLTEQEEKDLETKTSDFSVIKTSRRGTCLFLGPARFVNHDCDPNCSFMSAGSSAIYFKVQKPININDEITTHYGDNYFGVDNQECLCATCERLGQGGYKGKQLPEQEAQDVDVSEPDLEDSGRRLRNRRVNYYPTLMKKAAKKQKDTSVRPSTPLPPVEADTIPRGDTTLIPTQSYLDATPGIDNSSTPTTQTSSDADCDPVSMESRISGGGDMSLSSHVPDLLTASTETSQTSPPEFDNAASQDTSSSFITDAVNPSSRSLTPINELSNCAHLVPSPTIDMPSSPIIDIVSVDDVPPVKGFRPRIRALWRYGSRIIDRSFETDSTPTPENQPVVDNVSLSSKSLAMDNACENPSDNCPPSDNHSSPGDPALNSTSKVSDIALPVGESPSSISTDITNIDTDLLQGDSALADKMISLQLSETEANQAPTMEDRSIPSQATEQETETQEEDLTYNDHFDGDLSDVGIDEDIIMLSPKNFRMSLDFLCNTSGRNSPEQTESHPESMLSMWNSSSLDSHSDITNLSSRRASVQLSDGGDDSTKEPQKKNPKRVKPTANIVDPEHCSTCKAFIPEQERNGTSDCRRCYRHFAIYGLAWPSRGRQAIAERYKKAAQEEREKARKLKLAAEAAEAKAKQEQARIEAKARQEQARIEAKAKQNQAKLEARAKQNRAKAEAKAKQEQEKAAMRAQLEEQRLAALQRIEIRMKMGLPPLEKTKVDLHKKRRVKSTASVEPSCDDYQYMNDYSTQQILYDDSTTSFAYPDMINMNNPSNLQQMMHPHPTYQMSINHAPEPYQQDYYYTDLQNYSYEASTHPIIHTHPSHLHPFHYAPYVVFVDPQDENPDEFWWPAVTVPWNQQDSSMPSYNFDPDRILVRCLGDNTYAICDISGLILFDPDKEPYLSYSRRGREFERNVAMKRAMAILNERTVSTRFRWKNMDFSNQRSLADISDDLRQYEFRTKEMSILMRLRGLQNSYHQSTHQLHLMRSNLSCDPFALQEQERQLEQEYLQQMDQLRLEMRQIGGSLEYFDTTAAAIMSQIAPAFASNKNVNSQHSQVEHQRPSTTKTKRPRKSKSTIHHNTSSHIEQECISQSNDPKLLATNQTNDSNEPIDSINPVNSVNPKSKKRGPSRKQIRIDLQLSEHARLLEAASMGLHSIKTADGTLFKFTSTPPAQVNAYYSMSTPSQKGSNGYNSQVVTLDGNGQITTSHGESTDQSTLSPSGGLSALKIAPKARKKRPEKQTVDIAHLDTSVTLSAMMLPRSISLEPSCHQIVVMDSSPRFSSVFTLLSSSDNKEPFSSTWNLSDYDYSMTERRVFEGRFNCVDITLLQDRAGFVQKSPDNDMYLLDSNDLSAVSTPASSDSTETDISLSYGGSLEPTVPQSKSNKMELYRNEYKRSRVKGFVGLESNTEGDYHSTVDIFGTSELASLKLSSSPSSLNRHDQGVSTMGYGSGVVGSRDNGNPSADIEKILPIANEVFEIPTSTAPTDRDAMAVAEALLQIGHFDCDASSPFVPRNHPLMATWEHNTNLPGGINTAETLESAEKQKRVSKKSAKRNQQSSIQSSTALTLAPQSSPLLSLSKLVTTNVSQVQDSLREINQDQSRRKKKTQSGKARKVSSAKPKVTIGGTKQQNIRIAPDEAESPHDHSTKMKQANVYKNQSTHTKQQSEAPEDRRETVRENRGQISPVQFPRKKKGSRNKSMVAIEGKSAQLSLLEPTEATSNDSQVSNAKTKKKPKTKSKKPSKGSQASLLPKISNSTSSPSLNSISESSKSHIRKSTVEISNNRELLELSRWEIKVDAIEFDLDSNIRSVRSRVKKSESSAQALLPTLKPSKAKSIGNASKLHVASQAVNEAKPKPQKRRKLSHISEVTLQNISANETAVSTAKGKGGDGNEGEHSDLIDGTEPSETEAVIVETTGDGSNPDNNGDSDATNHVGQIVETPSLATDEKVATEDPLEHADADTAKSKFIKGEMLSLTKEPAIVVVKFTLSGNASPHESDESKDTTENSERRIPSSTKVLKKRGRKKKQVEVPNDQTFLQPVAVSTRKRVRQDTMDEESISNEEAPATESMALKANDTTENQHTLSESVTMAKRRRIRESNGLEKDKTSTSSDGEDKVDDVQSENTKDEISLEKKKERRLERDKEEVRLEVSNSDSPEESLIERPATRQSARRGQATLAEQDVLSVKDDTNSPTGTTRERKSDKSKKVDKVIAPFTASFAITVTNISSEGRLRIREKETKKPNTSKPRFKVGDSVQAPGEDDLMFDAEIKDRRDHKVLPEVYEYKVHYDGYAQK